MAPAEVVILYCREEGGRKRRPVSKYFYELNTYQV